MKKMKRFKKAAVLLMAAVMCFGMAGCKKTTGGETPTGDVYAPSFSEISSDVEYVTNVLAGDGRLSIMGQVYDRETYALSQKLITLDIATGAQTSRELVVDGDKKDDSEQISLQTIAVYKDGYMAVRYHYTQPTQEEIDSGVYESETSYDIAILDADFNIQSTVSLADLQKKVEESGGGFYVQYSASDAEGNIYISLDNSMLTACGLPYSMIIAFITFIVCDTARLTTGLVISFKVSLIFCPSSSLNNIDFPVQLSPTKSP